MQFYNNISCREDIDRRLIEIECGNKDVKDSIGRMEAMIECRFERLRSMYESGRVCKTNRALGVEGGQKDDWRGNVKRGSELHKISPTTPDVRSKSRSENDRVTRGEKTAAKITKRRSRKRLRMDNTEKSVWEDKQNRRQGKRIKVCIGLCQGISSIRKVKYKL